RRYPAPPSSQLTSRAVVVLPFVPVITIEPCVRSWVSRVRILGSITRATSPGSVVPPPRPVTRLRAPVALPARTAAVFLNIGAPRRGSASALRPVAQDRRSAPWLNFGAPRRGGRSRP